MVTTLPRIIARIDIDTQELLSQAAAIVGISSINSFLIVTGFGEVNNFKGLQ